MFLIKYHNFSFAEQKFIQLPLNTQCVCFFYANNSFSSYLSRYASEDILIMFLSVSREIEDIQVVDQVFMDTPMEEITVKALCQLKECDVVTTTKTNGTHEIIEDY